MGHVPSDELLSTHLEERVPDLLDRYDVPGASIVLVEDGEVTWSVAYGSADSAEGRSTAKVTPFRVQSITKSITAWGVLNLVERDEIELADPVGQHLANWELPDAEYPWEEVTVRRVLSYSGGLPAGVYEGVPLDEEPPPLREALSGNAGGPAARSTDEPGEFRYSNPGYALLVLLIEDVTGQDFAAYVDEEILEPLGMDGTTFDMTERLRSELATEHFVDGTPVPMSHGSAKAPGALYATAEDIARFVAAGTEASGEPVGRGVLAPESVAEINTPTVGTTGFYSLASDSAGLGHFVESLSDGERAVMNGGQGAGSWNWFHAVLETGDGAAAETSAVSLIASSGTDPEFLEYSNPWQFFAIAFGVSYLFWIPLIALEYDPFVMPGLILFVAGGLGVPGAAIFLLFWTAEKRHRRDYWRRLVDIRRIDLRWYAVIFLLVPTLNGLALLALDGSPATASSSRYSRWIDTC